MLVWEGGWRTNLTLEDIYPSCCTQQHCPPPISDISAARMEQEQTCRGRSDAFQYCGTNLNSFKLLLVFRLSAGPFPRPKSDIYGRTGLQPQLDCMKSGKLFFPDLPPRGAPRCPPQARSAPTRLSNVCNGCTSVTRCNCSCINPQGAVGFALREKSTHSRRRRRSCALCVVSGGVRFFNVLLPCPTGSSCQSSFTQGLKVNDVVYVSLADQTDESVFMLFKGLLSDDVIACGPVMLLLEEDVLTVPGYTQFLHHLGEELGFWDKSWWLFPLQQLLCRVTTQEKEPF